MPIPDYEELYSLWLRTAVGTWAKQHAEKHPDPRKWDVPVTWRRLLLVLLLALMSCGLTWCACRLVT